MATAGSSPLPPSSDPDPEGRGTLLHRLLRRTVRIVNSWFGLFVAYFAAFSGAILAFQKLEEPLKGYPRWMRLALVLLPLVLAFLVHTLPATLDSYRRRHLNEIKGELKAGYFRLSPRDKIEGFSRVDNKHQEVFDWVADPPSEILYLTGLSGSGKSSLLSAWVIPKLSQQSPGVLTLKLRGFQDPATQLESELRKPGIIWQRPPTGQENLRSLLERACKQIKPKRLLIVFDQFEEFVILQGHADRERFEALLNSIIQYPIDGLTVLLVLRSDYVGMLEELGVPKLVQLQNWREVPPFTESAAYRFITGSGLRFSDEMLKKVLKEAAEVEGTKGLIRPVTLNLCGLVLERFHGGLPRGFRPGGLLRGFLQETVFLPKIREVSPKVLPLLISQNLTKKPGRIVDIAREASLPKSEVRGCLRTLGMSDRGIVRPLDEQQETWEIAHDFLVPLLDSILARRRVPLWRRFRPWVPWVSAAMLLISAPILYDIVAREEAISKQVERSLQPIADIRISYSVGVPIDEPDMKSYRYRLIEGAKIIAKQPIHKYTHGGYISAWSKPGGPYQIGIPQSSALMPRPEEVVPFYVIEYTALQFAFYKNYVDLESGPWPQGKPDISFEVYSRPATLQFDLNSREVWVENGATKIDEKHLQSSGQIAAIPDLSHALLILKIRSFTFPTLDSENPDVAKIDALRKMMRIRGRVTLRIGSREFRITELQFACKQDDQGWPYCTFVFPADLNTLQDY